MIGFVEASKLFFTRAFDFNGRSSRAEYWWAYLMLIILYLVASVVLSVLGEIGLILLVVLMLGIFIPSLSIGVRRLHDTDRSGWWYLIALIPLANLVLLVFFCLEGTEGANKYGEDPYGGVPADVFS